MTPLDATTTRSKLADNTTNPDVTSIGQLVEVLLKFTGGVTSTGTTAAGGLTGLLSALGAGIPQFPGPDFSKGVIKAWYDPVLSNRLASANLAETDVTGWTQNAATGSVARSTAQKIADSGAASALQTNPGTNASEGVRADWAPTDLSLIQNQRIRVGAWFYGATVVGAINLGIEERAAGASVGTTNAGSITLAAGWQFLSAVRNFGATADTARIICRNNATSNNAWHVDGVALAPQSYPGVTVVPLSAVGGEDPGHLTLLLKFLGVTFAPDMLYDALDYFYPTVTSDKDDMARGTYEFTIAP